MILVDTSVWIEHFRAGNDRLKGLLLDEQVLCHPFVVGELACGTMRKHTEILSMLKSLPQVQLLEHEEVLGFLEA
jgi:predicted nucleic acid-binding protein